VIVRNGVGHSVSMTHRCCVRFATSQQYGVQNERNLRFMKRTRVYNRQPPQTTAVARDLVWRAGCAARWSSTQHRRARDLPRSLARQTGKPMDAPENVRPPISILIAVGVRLYREGLATALSARQQLRVDATVATVLDAQAAVTAREPDVIIIDVSLPDVCAAMRVIRGASSRSRILAFAVREDIRAILDYAEAGADGFVTANGSVSELVEAIERLAAGELLCSPRIAAQLLKRAARQSDESTGQAGGPVLTLREQQVFALIKQGLSNKEIGNSLCISEATVKNHVHHVLEKLQVTSRGQAAASKACSLNPWI
jgi:two-component system nitrate/nitrite response regulator NarL